MTDCLSPHLFPPQPGFRLLTWLQTRNDPRERTLAWTCHCQPVIYELCAAGGQSFLRRTEPATRSITETHRVSTRDGQRLWADLLEGRAR